MIKIIKKISKFLSTDTSEVSDNAIDFREELIEKIVGNSFFKRFSMDDAVTDPFVLWVTTEGQNYQTEVRKQDFIKCLRKAFDDAELPEVGSNAQWIVKTETLPEGSNFHKIEEGIYLDIRPLAEQQEEIPDRNIPTKARISIAESSGSLFRSEYLLDAEQQQIWQIGRGEKDRTGKKNHIAISDNEKDKLYENNKYVSSTQAQIIFLANKGFCMKSLNDNNRNIIYRNENRISDLKDLHSVSVPLENGDYIELGKKVLLKYAH